MVSHIFKKIQFSALQSQSVQPGTCCVGRCQAVARLLLPLFVCQCLLRCSYLAPNIILIVTLLQRSEKLIEKGVVLQSQNDLTQSAFGILECYLNKKHRQVACRQLSLTLLRPHRQPAAHACSVTSDPVTPWAVAHQAPLPMQFSRQEYWSELLCPPLGNVSNSGIEPQFVYASCIGRWVLYHQPHLGNPGSMDVC